MLHFTHSCILLNTCFAFHIGASVPPKGCGNCLQKVLFIETAECLSLKEGFFYFVQLEPTLPWIFNMCSVHTTGPMFHYPCETCDNVNVMSALIVTLLLFLNEIANMFYMFVMYFIICFSMKV